MAKRVLLVRGGALPRASGLGRAHHELLDRLSSGVVSGYELAQVIEHPLGGNPLVRWWRRKFSHPARVAKAAKTDEKREIDLIHITDQEQAHLVPKNSAVPVSVTVHDLFHLRPRVVVEVEVGEHAPTAVRKRDLESLEAGLGRADSLVCISHATAEECQKIWPDKQIAVVHHAIDGEPYLEPRELGVRNFVLITVGSNEPRKRLDFIDQIVSSLEENVKDDLNLIKIGSHLQLSDDELIAAYQRAEALLFPSAGEGFGLPVLEAMAAGCPVLCSDLPAHNEVADPSMRLPADDVEAWVSAITDLHGEWLDREGATRSANPVALQRAAKFDLQSWGENLAAAWNSMVAK